ncbi:MAG: ABC transporter permease [Gemmatimonadales bacterium]
MMTKTWILIRQLALHRTFAVTTICTLAVGIGATTAIFSTVNATLLRPLPYPYPEDIYELRAPLIDGRTSSGRVSGAYVAAVREGAPSVSHVVAVVDQENVLTAPDGEAQPVLVQLVTEGFFDLFGLPMAQGRGFVPEDHEFRARGVVLSHRLWTTRFGGDPSVVGEPIGLLEGSFPVVGVAHEEFDVPRGTDVWMSIEIPAGFQQFNHVGESYLRARPGTDLRILQGELDTVVAGLVAQYPEVATGRAFVITPAVASLIGDLGAILLIVLGGALLLLLVGAVNVATLILARGVGRSSEVAIRIALGAGRWSIARSFFAEALLLSVVGTLLGLLLAWLGVHALGGLGVRTLPRLDTIPFDGRVLAFAGATLVATTVLIGLVPAAILTNVDVQRLLSGMGRSNSRTRGSKRVLRGLVVAEIALAITLVSGAGLMVRSYENVTNAPLGFEPEGRLVLTAHLQGTQWAPGPAVIIGPNGERMLDPNPPPSETPTSWFRQVSDRLLASAQIESVGAGRSVPFRADWDGMVYVAASEETYDRNAREAARLRRVSHTFLDAMGTRLLAGRGFAESEDVPVAIVNETFARTLYPGQDALHQTFGGGSPEVSFEYKIPIIGVVEDTRFASPTLPAVPEFFMLGLDTRVLVVVKTTLEDPTPLIPVVRAEVASIDPTVPITVEALPAIVSTQLARSRIGLTLMGLFAVMSLALAGVGIYGVLSNLTKDRRTELATHAALGAAPADVRDLVVREGSVLGALGTIIGIALSYTGGRVASSRLFEVPQFDPPMIVVAVTTVLGVTMIAVVLPALYAGRTSPADGLRAE